MKTGPFPIGKVQTRGKIGSSDQKRRAISADDASALAISALSFLAGDPERLEPFLSLTGLSPGNLRKIAGNSEFLGAVLDHLANDEPLLLAFCASGQHDPLTVMQARIALGAMSTWDST